MFAKLVRFFKSLKDYRVKGRSKYPLYTILIIVFVSILCGARGWKGIHEYATANAYWFRKRIPGLTDIPSVDTLARTISKLNPDELNKAITKLAKEFLRHSKHRKPGRKRKLDLPDMINLDGKNVRGAIKPGQLHSRTHIVNAVCGLITLAVGTVQEKSNEITIIPRVLDLLFQCKMLKGKVITIDAMGCQKKIVAKIIGYGADYLIGLKGNQGTLYDDVQTVFDTGLRFNSKEFIYKSFTTEAEKAGGRVEHRVVTVVKMTSVNINEWLTTANDWDGIKTIIKVETINDTEGSSEIRYFVSSLDRSPKQIAEIQKLHWQVETLHKILDDRNSFDEDHCKIYRGNGAEILSTMRKLAINFLAPIRQASKDNESQKESFSSILKLLYSCNEYLDEVLTKQVDKIPPPSVWRERIGNGMYAK